MVGHPVSPSTCRILGLACFTPSGPPSSKFKICTLVYNLSAMIMYSERVLCLLQEQEFKCIKFLWVGRRQRKNHWRLLHDTRDISTSVGAGTFHPSIKYIWVVSRPRSRPSLLGLAHTLDPVLSPPTVLLLFFHLRVIRHPFGELSRIASALDLWR